MPLAEALGAARPLADGAAAALTFRRGSSRRTKRTSD
jgi:hypothetical protein